MLLPDHYAKVLVRRDAHRPASDFVAQLALTGLPGLERRLRPAVESAEPSETERSEVNIQYKPAGQSVINVGYRFQRDVLEQAEVSSSWPVGDAWNVFVREIYSLQDHKPLERFAGFEYRACCWRVRVGGRSFVSSRTGSSDTGVYLQLELTGLASVGSESDSFLTAAIRGYVPADSPLTKPRAP